MIRLLIVDDDPLVRSALSLMLGGQPDLEVAGEAADGQAALDEIARRSTGDEPIDLVLMDIRMPVLDGLAATRAIRRDPHGPRVIVLTTFDGEEHVLPALSGGADGFLLKDTAPADIVAAIRSVIAGEPMLSPSVTATLISAVRTQPSAPAASQQQAVAAAARLTDREREVAHAVARGLSNAEIAKELYMSVATVKAHVSKLFEKLEVTNRVQIAIVMHEARGQD